MFDIKNTDKHIKVYFNGDLIVSVDKVAIEKNFNKKDDDQKVKISDVTRFINEYRRQQKLFYGHEVFKKINRNSKNYTYLKEACELSLRHKIDAKNYIKAQVAGLEFANKFPQPNQMATDAAEQRLLEFIRSENVRNQKLPFGTKDKDTPLRENQKYMEIADRFKKGRATYHEVLYLAKCQKARKAKVSPHVREFIENARKDRKSPKKA